MKKLILLSALLIFACGFGQTPITDANFSQAIETCLSTHPVTGMCSDSEYGSMPNWDVSNVTDMRNSFEDRQQFNADISSWDVSSVIYFQWMFYNASSFNQNIINWVTSSAIDMGGMFSKANSFNQDIDAWDTSSVITMGFMFYENLAFNQNLGNWDTSNVTNMESMFYGSSFNRDISIWNTSFVTFMNNMFKNATAFNQDIGSWNTLSVTNMSAMFRNADAFNQDISSWDVTSVNNMNEMFFSADSFNQNISSWCVTNIVSEPNSSSTGSPLIEENKPVWGTCPTAGVDEHRQLESSIYPNPVKNILTIDGLVIQDVVIYSVLGKAVLILSNQNTIDVSSLSKGVYFIKVSDGINSTTIKFIKN